MDAEQYSDWPIPIPESERIINWRLQNLIRAGWDRDMADLIAAETAIDLHQACELLKDCSAELAARILL